MQGLQPILLPQEIFCKTTRWLYRKELHPSVIVWEEGFPFMQTSFYLSKRQSLITEDALPLTLFKRQIHFMPRCYSFGEVWINIFLTNKSLPLPMRLRMPANHLLIKLFLMPTMVSLMMKRPVIMNGQQKKHGLLLY